MSVPRAKGKIMQILESGENYLETIYLLLQEKGFVRAIDVAGRMNYSKPSVSRALGILKKAGYLLIDDKTGGLALTEEGRVRAQSVFARHAVITRLLVRLGVSQEVAEQDACRIEHVVSEETFNAMCDYMDQEEC